MKRFYFIPLVLFLALCSVALAAVSQPPAKPNRFATALAGLNQSAAKPNRFLDFFQVGSHITLTSFSGSSYEVQFVPGKEVEEEKGEAQKKAESTGRPIAKTATAYRIVAKGDDYMELEIVKGMGQRQNQGKRFILPASSIRHIWITAKTSG